MPGWLLRRTMVLASVLAVPAPATPLAITNVTLIDVEDGRKRPALTVVVEGDRITALGSAVRIPAGSRRIDGSGKYLIPGLWDMHVHSHRDGRWAWHWPLLRAHGVVGVRDAGSHLATALTLMRVADPLAPRIIWGSPMIDGAPPVNDFGLVAEHPAAGRALVRLLKQQGFAFIKVYDRLRPDTHAAIADEARRQRIPVEGHVPLLLSPVAVAKAGQRLIDHLTLVVEACTPGGLQPAQSAMMDPANADSMSLLTAPALANVRPDPTACEAQYRALAARGVWQVPTLVQAQGYFRVASAELATDPRLALVPPAVAQEWLEHSRAADPVTQARGRAVVEAQMEQLPLMAAAGVPIMAGTDASTEAWVVPGLSLHEEMALLVKAGLGRLQALQAATLAPRRYQGLARADRLLAVGQAADLLLLEADPLLDIANSRRIAAVVARGRMHDRADLDHLIASASSRRQQVSGASQIP